MRSISKTILKKPLQHHTGENTKHVTAPGQIFLFGEHAVVYGQPALVVSIGLRTDVKAKRLDTSRFEAVSEGVGKVSGNIKKSPEGWKIADTQGDKEKLKYILKVSENVFKHLDSGSGIKLSISSELPLGAGLGSSSSVTTAVSEAVALTQGEKIEKETIIDLAYQAEKEIQGRASRAGVGVAVHGGFLKIKNDKLETLEDLSNPDIIVGYTGKNAKTCELVEKVKKQKSKSPNIYDPMIRAIGQTTREGIRNLRSNEIEKVGVLMNVNQSLLEGLGVSTSHLNQLIQSSRDAGALGAKITGAGGGGCMISLCRKNAGKIKNAIDRENGIPIRTEISGGGLKIDSE